jgi:phage-related tail protein
MYIRAMKRSYNDDPAEKQLVKSMIARLIQGMEKDNGLLCKTDHGMLMTVFESDFDGDTPESLGKWLYKVA